MPYRTYPLIIGLVGVATIIMLLAARADLAEHARSGPRWKRRLVAAGVLLLATLGLAPALGTGCSSQNGSASPPETPTTSDPAGPDTVTPLAASPDTTAPPSKVAPLESSRLWKQIAETMAEAEEIAAGKRGSHPFNERGKERLLAALKTAGENADALQAQALLGPGEAALVKLDLLRLAGKVSEFRPTEMEGATCYQRRVIPPPAKLSMHRLNQRLPLLEKMAANETLHPVAITKALDKIHADVELLENEEQLSQLAGDNERNEAKRLATEVKARLTKLRARVANQ